MTQPIAQAATQAMPNGPVLEDRALDLRRAFDQAFAGAPPVEEEGAVDLLLVRIAGQPFALPAGEIAGAAKARALVPVPSRRPDVLGLAGIRGAVICVHSMAILLGLAEEAASLAWLALAGSEEPIGLAFQQLEGFVRVPAVRLRTDGALAAGRFIKGALKSGPAGRLVVDVRAMLDAIRNTAGASGAALEKE